MARPHSAMTDSHCPCCAASRAAVMLASAAAVRAMIAMTLVTAVARTSAETVTAPAVAAIL
jgi:hypothetical protein